MGAQPLRAVRVPGGHAVRAPGVLPAVDHAGPLPEGRPLRGVPAGVGARVWLPGPRTEPALPWGGRGPRLRGPVVGLAGAGAGSAVAGAVGHPGELWRGAAWAVEPVGGAPAGSAEESARWPLPPPREGLPSPGGRGAAGHAAEVRSLWLKACHGLATVEEHRRLVEEGSRVDGPWSAYVLRRHRRRRSVVGRFLLRMEEESIAWRLSEPPLPSPRAPAL